MSGCRYPGVDQHGQEQKCVCDDNGCRSSKVADAHVVAANQISVALSEQRGRYSRPKDQKPVEKDRNRRGQRVAYRWSCHLAKCLTISSNALQRSQGREGERSHFAVIAGQSQHLRIRVWQDPTEDSVCVPEEEEKHCRTTG